MRTLPHDSDSLKISWTSQHPPEKYIYNNYSIRPAARPTTASNAALFLLTTEEALFVDGTLSEVSVGALVPFAAGALVVGAPVVGPGIPAEGTPWALAYRL